LALCIIRDDLDDWSKEAPRMGQLYRDADMVIAASGALDSSDGCFIERIAPERSIEIPFRKEDSTRDGHIQLSMKGYSSHSFGPVWEPLGKRGWVLQEWALARRLVHFTSKGMMWSCRQLGESVMCEDGAPAVGTDALN
jgi:hypothetical protein